MPPAQYDYRWIGLVLNTLGRNTEMWCTKKMKRWIVRPTSREMAANKAIEIAYSPWRWFNLGQAMSATCYLLDGSCLPMRGQAILQDKPVVVVVFAVEDQVHYLGTIVSKNDWIELEELFGVSVVKRGSDEPISASMVPWGLVTGVANLASPLELQDAARRLLRCADIRMPVLRWPSQTPPELVAGIQAEQQRRPQAVLCDGCTTIDPRLALPGIFRDFDFDPSLCADGLPTCYQCGGLAIVLEDTAFQTKVASIAAIRRELAGYILAGKPREEPRIAELTRQGLEATRVLYREYGYLVPPVLHCYGAMVSRDDQC